MVENAKENLLSVGRMLGVIWDLSVKTDFVKRAVAMTTTVLLDRFVKISVACPMGNADRTLIAAWAPFAIEAPARLVVAMTGIAPTALNAKVVAACQRWSADKTLTVRPTLFAKVMSVLPTYHASVTSTAQGNWYAIEVYAKNRLDAEMMRIAQTARFVIQRPTNV